MTFSYVDREQTERMRWDKMRRYDGDLLGEVRTLEALTEFCARDSVAEGRVNEVSGSK